MRRLVASIPGAAGWRTDASGDRYQELATKLRAYGVPADDVYDVLVDAYEAATAEVRT